VLNKTDKTNKINSETNLTDDAQGDPWILMNTRQHKNKTNQIKTKAGRPLWAVIADLVYALPK